MASIGRLDDFNPDTEEWTQYVERMKFYFIANDITSAAKQKATFLVVMGPSTYKLLRSLIAPAKAEDKPLDELTKVLQDHFSPKPSAIVQRSKFYNRVRRHGESVTTFLSELRKLAEFCNFENKLEDMLRDKLICGINDTAMQRKLLSEGDQLTLEDALKLALSMETAFKDTQELIPLNGIATNTSSINKISPYIRRGSSTNSNGRTARRTGNTRNPTSCYRCLGEGHTPDSCHYKREKCFHCQKIGHIKRACRSSSATKPSSFSQRRHNTPPQQIQQIAEDDTEIEYKLQNNMTLNNVNSVTAKKPIALRVEIEGVTHKMELDTGAAVSIISNVNYQKFWKEKPLQRTSVKLKTYSGENLIVHGMLKVKVQNETQQSELTLIVVDGNGPGLFGRDWLDQLKLNWKSICRVEQVHSSMRLNKVS